jgi:hypothetical protein
MAKVMLKCPNCGQQVELGDIECKHCGLNLKSGESYESQVKKAKGKAEHPEHFSSPVFVGAALAFSLFLFAGYMYQRRMETAVRDRPDLLVPAIEEFQQIDDLVHAKEYVQAQQRTQALIASLDKRAASIDVPEPYAKEDTSPWRRPQAKYNRAAVRRLLLTLKAKAERKLTEIPTA